MRGKGVLFYGLFLMFIIQSCHNDNAITKHTTNKKLKCLFFFIPDCPVCKNNFNKVLVLRDKYKANGLEITAIYSDQYWDSLILKNMIDEYRFDIPVIIDKDLNIAKEYHITTTPQFILMDSTNVVIYNGMMDDYYYSLGKHHNYISKSYLENAIISAFKGEQPQINVTEPIGCKINYSIANNK